MVRGRSWVVNRGRVVRSRGRFVWSGLVFGVLGFTRVGNISDISTISIINTVSDSLDSAVGESNIVASRGSISVTLFSGTKVSSGVVISNGIGVVVCWGDISVYWGGVAIDGGRMIRGGWASSHGNSHEGSNSNEGLEKKYFISG